MSSMVRWMMTMMLLGGAGCEPAGRPADQRRPAVADAEQIVSARALGSLDTAVHAPGSAPAVANVSCNTCHEYPATWPMAREVAELDEFHSELRLEHGTNVCASCHAPDQRDQLRLADGTLLPFEQTQRLCAQCHGSQQRDYEHGAHGGMSGYWDKQRGKRIRNLCTNCHDPHAPAYPSVIPAPPPRDRFLNADRHGEAHQ
jgi:hypothetical protein